MKRQMPIDRNKVVGPGGMLGIIGGGQLGRMTALAAARLGSKGHISGPEPGSTVFSV